MKKIRSGDLCLSNESWPEGRGKITDPHLLEFISIHSDNDTYSSSDPEYSGESRSLRRKIVLLLHCSIVKMQAHVLDSAKFILSRESKSCTRTVIRNNLEMSFRT